MDLRDSTSTSQSIRMDEAYCMKTAGGLFSLHVGRRACLCARQTVSSYICVHVCACVLKLVSRCLCCQSSPAGHIQYVLGQPGAQGALGQVLDSRRGEKAQRPRLTCRSLFEGKYKRDTLTKLNLLPIRSVTCEHMSVRHIHCPPWLFMDKCLLSCLNYFN